MTQGESQQSRIFCNLKKQGLYYKHIETAPELLREVSAKPPLKMLKIIFGKLSTVGKTLLLMVADFAPLSNKTSAAYNATHLSISEWSLLPFYRQYSYMSLSLCLNSSCVSHCCAHTTTGASNFLNDVRPKAKSPHHSY